MSDELIAKWSPWTWTQSLWQDQDFMENYWRSRSPPTDYHPLREFDRSIPGFHRGGKDE
jgi:hypothetical protein